MKAGISSIRFGAGPGAQQVLQQGFADDVERDLAAASGQTSATAGQQRGGIRARHRPCRKDRQRERADAAVASIIGE
jgi:hypothetical protein